MRLVIVFLRVFVLFKFILRLISVLIFKFNVCFGFLYFWSFRS